MKIVRFCDATQALAHGIVQGESVLRIENTPPGGLEDWLGLGGTALQDIAATALQSNKRVRLRSVQLLAPIARPRKFLGLGANFTSHLKELADLGLKLPEGQVWFNKQTSCITGPFDEVVIPALSNQVDYEGELAVVIGRRCRHVPLECARDVIAGFMVCNDVSARDVQMRSPTMTLGKSFDTHGPTGPWLVTPEEISDPQRLRIRTWINGELRQDGNTLEMRYSIFEQIAELSRVFTLEPGDILATGTPAGIGAAMRPPRYLKVGDVARVEIDQVGTIENRFVADAPATD